MPRNSFLGVRIKFLRFMLGARSTRGTKKSRPSDLDNLLASLHTLVNSFEAKMGHGYFQGAEAYEQYIAGLRKDQLWPRRMYPPAGGFPSRTTSRNGCTLPQHSTRTSCLPPPEKGRKVHPGLARRSWPNPQSLAVGGSPFLDINNLLLLPGLFGGEGHNVAFQGVFQVS